MKYLNKNLALISTIVFIILLFTSIIVGQKPNFYSLPVKNFVEYSIVSDEMNFHSIDLKKGQAIHIDLFEKGVDIDVKLLKFKGLEVIAHNDFGYGYDRETLTSVATETGSYIIVVLSTEKNKSGKYELYARVEEVVTESENHRIKAEKLMIEAIKNRDDNVTNLRFAIEKWEESLSLWRSLGEKYWVGYVNYFLGVNYFSLGENKKALAYYYESLSLFRVLGDKYREAATLINIGSLYTRLGEFQQSIDQVKQYCLRSLFFVTEIDLYILKHR